MFPYTVVNERVLKNGGARNPRTFIPAVGTAPYTARNGALNDRKRRFTALISTLFHRNPSVRITTAVSGRFLLRNDHRFTPFLNTFLDWRITTAVSSRFPPVYSRFRPFTRRSVGPGISFLSFYTTLPLRWNLSLKINDLVDACVVGRESRFY